MFDSLQQQILNRGHKTIMQAVRWSGGVDPSEIFPELLRRGKSREVLGIQCIGGDRNTWSSFPLRPPQERVLDLLCCRTEHVGSPEVRYGCIELQFPFGPERNLSVSYCRQVATRLPNSKQSN